MLTLKNIRINRLSQPRLVGADTAPRFSWQLTSADRGCMQEAYQVKILSENECVFDSGRVESDDSVDVTFQGLTLAPETDYEVTVSVWDNHGNAATAKAAFSTALGEDGWRGAKWITPKHLLSGGSPYLRHKFKVEKPVRYATLYVCGLGLGEYYLNGERLSEAKVDPIATNYEKIVFYRRYDVTHRLTQGGNALALWLGDGFYGQNRLWLDHANTCYGQVCGIARLHILYEDGAEDNIVTNPDTWQAKQSPITLNNLYAGEVYDARLEDADFARYEGDGDGWGKTTLATPPEGKLVGCDLPPVAVTKRLPAKSVAVESGQHDGAYIFDFGENFAGVFQVKIPPSPVGATYVFRCAETLCNGHLDFRTTGSYATECIQQDIYICRGDKNGETYTPRFTYHGFRYLEVTGFYTLADGYGAPPRLDSITGIALSTDMNETGGFSGDNEHLNRLFGIMKHTYRANFHGFPEDCPAREKCGWLGDAQAVCDFGLLAYDTAALYEKYLDDIATTKEVYGEWKMISPGRRGCGEATALWGCAQILIPYALWQYQGDRFAIMRHLPLMHEWVKHEAERANGLIIQDGLGDWLPPVGNKSPLRMPVAHSSTLMFYEICEKMATVCCHFDKKHQDQYVNLAQSVKEAFIKTFYQKDAHTYGYDGTDAAALCLGIYPEGEEEHLSKSLMTRLGNSDYQMTTAIYGTKYLVAALLEKGYGEEALRLLFHPTHPAYGTMMAQGATTVWEVLEMTIPEPDRKKRLFSLNHPMHGGFLYTAFTHLGGIRPKRAGYKQFLFSPVKNCPLASASVWQETPYGQIKVQQQKVNSGILYTLTVPENAQAILNISWAKSIKVDQTPAENGEILGSGTYKIFAEQ